MATTPDPTAEQPRVHQLDNDALRVRALDDGTWELTVTAPDGAPIVLVGTYSQMEAALAEVFHAVHPNSDDVALIEQRIWDALIETIRVNMSPAALIDRELTIDAYLDQIDSFHIDSDEWENGWYPGTARAQTADETDLEVENHFEESLVMADAIGEHSDALMVLRGRAGPSWSYLITRPSNRPLSTAHAA